MPREISTTIRSIEQIMRKDAGVDGAAQRIGQLAWMLFLKIFDDQDAELAVLRNGYRSPIPKKLRWRNWAANPEGITGETLLRFVDREMFPALKNLRGSDPRAAVVRRAFEDAINYMRNGTLMRQVVNKIAGIDFNSYEDRHAFGEVYEKILKDLQSAGSAGEFYTPRAVTQFMTEMTAPDLRDSVLDPACGTGGFLTCAIEHIRKNHVKTPRGERSLQGRVSGVEKKHLPHLLCTTNMLLHGMDVPGNILHDNTLARPLRDYGPRERVSVVLTNPPFGGMEEDGIEQNFPAAFRTRETADLFLVFIMHILKPGGRCAMVLPDGSLFGEGVKTRIKEKLLKECNLHTIIRLPKSVFAPYTSIRTNLLFFEKGRPTKEIWYYEHPLPHGYKAYGKTRPIRIEEFEPEKKWWKRRRQSERAWRVPAAQVARRGYNLDIANPNAADAGPGDPDELLARHAQAAAETAALSEKLRASLQAALERN